MRIMCIAPGIPSTGVAIIDNGVLENAFDVWSSGEDLVGNVRFVSVWASSWLREPCPDVVVIEQSQEQVLAGSLLHVFLGVPKVYLPRPEDWRGKAGRLEIYYRVMQRLDDRTAARFRAAG